MRFLARVAALFLVSATLTACGDTATSNKKQEVADAGSVSDTPGGTSAGDTVGPAPDNGGNTPADNGGNTPPDNGGKVDVDPGEPDVAPDPDTKNEPEPDIVVPECNEAATNALYEKRIEPLMSGEKPSTCNQCHLSGVDLGTFAQDTPCQSMACLVKLDLVDLSAPEKSTILEQILLAKPESDLITPQVIQEEHDGFWEWIQYSSQCHNSVCGEISDPCNSGTGKSTAESGVPYPLGDSCEEPAIGAKFESLVYLWKGRCQGCHSSTVNTPGACGQPCEAGKVCKNIKGEAKCVVLAPYWVDLNYAEGNPQSMSAASLRTMYNLIGLGSFDVESPVDSLLLTKPLDEAYGGVWHGGGAKIKNKQEQTYIDYLEFVTAYAACYSGTLVPPDPPTPQIPEVIIKSPKDGATLPKNHDINFKGWAMDEQDGEISSKKVLVWTSDKLDGAIGKGWNVVAMLPVGNHKITLTATDSDGNVGTGSISITVK